MTKYNLSYVIATRNRLPFLKITLSLLIAELQVDEEIVVVDGNSSDGSKDYLQSLFEEGKINQFISEPDKNQAHAWNKAMLLARGCIIKKIIDDDVFCYAAIRTCKAYMLQNPAVDVVISNDLASTLYDHQYIQKLSRLPQFEKWNKGAARSFTFGDVNMLIRKSALAYIGLYNTGYVMMDWEYSLRISYLRSNITYYTGYTALSVDHLQSVSASKNEKLTNEQGERGKIFYEYEGDDAGISLWSKIKIFAGKVVYAKKHSAAAPVQKIKPDELRDIYNYYYNYLCDLNSAAPAGFIDSLHGKHRAGS